MKTSITFLKKQTWQLWSMTLLFAFCFLAFIPVQSEKGPTAMAIQSNCENSLNLEVETITFTRTKNEGDRNNMSFIDKIRTKPVSEKQHIEACISPNNDSEMTISKQAPKFAPNLARTSNLNEASVTKIVGNQVSYYNETGELIRQDEVENLDQQMGLPSVISALASPSQSINGIISAGSSDNNEVVHLDDRYVRVKKYLIGSGFTTVMLIDKLKSRLVCSDLYDTEDKVINRMFMKYDDGLNNQMPAEVFQKIYEISPSSGLELVTEVISRIKYL